MKQNLAQARRGAEVAFGRFEVIKELGSGGFGQVLLCKDRESGELTAVKELYRFGADALLRFKNEFRVLADVRHENLVRLGELYEGGGRWWFSLEYVPGRDALSHVRTGLNDPGFHEQKLRAMTTGLFTGLHAMHAMGVLHRDLKPGNIRVTPSGRVVLLDFGLATHLERGKQSSDAASFGTVAYMAPEVGEGVPLTAAADLYSVGVLLYEALTGSLPYDGSAVHIMLAKGLGPPPRPVELVSGIPHDLDALCMALLAQDPSERPTATAALAALAQGVTSRENSARSLRPSELFVGRVQELKVLRSSYERAQREGFRMLLVEGESGMGKSALVQQLASKLSDEDPSVLVLASKCHAAELIGFKAFDGVVDELSRYLRGLPYAECGMLPPDEAHLLSLLFPVLDGVPSISRESRQSDTLLPDRFQQFDAFMALLNRVARERKLVFIVDDLQWADEASLALLQFLLDTPRAPKLFFLATVRPLETLTDTVGQGLRRLAAHEHSEHFTLNALSEPDARALAARLCKQSDTSSGVVELAKESGGHPLFVSELARHARESIAPLAGQGLDAALLARMRRLDGVETSVLELSCISGGPLPASMLRLALGEHAAGLREVLGSLRVQRVLRTTRQGETAVYHDRIREAVVRHLSPASVEKHHRSLARAWEKAEAPDPARVAMHWLGCNEQVRAAPWLEHAARQAELGGAFERAVEHYRVLLSLENIEKSREETHRLELALSEALASAGRCAESARVLLRALDDANEKQAPELAIRAAQRLLQAGQVQEGLAAVEKAFVRLDMAWPVSKAAVIARMLWNRIAIRLQGFEVREASREIDDAERFVLDALRRLSMPLWWVDLFRSAELVSRHAKLALETADPTHAAYATSTEAVMLATRGAKPDEIERVFAGAQAWRTRKDSEELQAYEHLFRGCSDMFLCDFRSAEAHFVESERIYRTQCAGSVWELTNVRAGLLQSWHLLGQFRRHAEPAQRWMDEAAARKDHFALATYSLTGLGAFRHVYADAPQLALREIEEVMTLWRGETVGNQHYAELLAAGWVLNYEASGRTDAYWRERWPRLESSFLFRLPSLRDTLVGARLGSVLAQTSSTGLSPAARAEARSLLKCLRQGKSRVGQSLAVFQQAQLAWLDGDISGTASLAIDAQRRFEAMGHFGARHADLLRARAEDAPDAHDREQRLLAWLASEGWLNPERALNYVLPVARTWR